MRNISSGVVRLTDAARRKNKVAGYLDRIRKFRGHENSAPAGYAIAGEATDIRAPKQVLHHRIEVDQHGDAASCWSRPGFAINNESYTLSRRTRRAQLEQAVGRRPPLVIPKRDSLQTAYGAYDGGLYYREPIRKTFVGLGVVRDRLAHIKAGIAVRLRLLLPAAARSGGPDPALSHGVPAQVIIHNTPQDSLQIMNAGPGHLRAGLVDAGPLHHQPRRALRALQRLDRRARRRGGPVRAGAAFRRDGRTCRTGTTSSPRFGFAWDVQGNGKTAVKVGFGKYMRAY